VQDNALVARQAHQAAWGLNGARELGGRQQEETLENQSSFHGRSARNWKHYNYTIGDGVNAN
jgi:hypothetical protein